MLVKLFLLFVLIPIAEIWLLWKIAEYTSFLHTVVLVIVTGFIGATLARRQGVRTWQRVERELSQGKMPADAVIDAVLILVAGVVLITPGVMTDLFGFALLIPPVRSLIKKYFVKRYKNRISFHTNLHPMNRGSDNYSDEIIEEDDNTIESRFEDSADHDRVIGSRIIDSHVSDKQQNNDD